MTGPGPQARLGFVLKGYPRLSETFIAQEIENLETRGFLIDIWSLRRPTDKTRHPVHDRIDAPVTYLPEYLHEEPIRVARALSQVQALPGFAAAWSVFARDLWRDFSRNRIRRFGQAAVLAAEAPDAITHFHAHFLHTPASVARYAAVMTGRGWSFSAHAKDIWTIEEWEKREKLTDARFGVTCTGAGAAHLNSLGTPQAGPVERMVHGIDISRFDGTVHDAAGPLCIVSVGRAVAKKGYPTLLRALTKLPEDVDWRFEHMGGGTMARTLKDEAARLGLADRITWHGARPQDDVHTLLARADLFVLASENQADGDRDGIPNVILEAMAMGVPVVATDAGAISEAITDGETGRLAPAGQVDALAEIIAELSRDPDRRERLGAAGAALVRDRFDAQPRADELARLIARHVPEAAP